MMKQGLHFFVQGLKLILGFAAIFSLVIFVNKFNINRQFPIKTVQVYGANHADQKQIQQMLSPLVRKSFFATNVEVIRKRLLHMPWIETTSVRRVWPDSVEVKIVEKNAIGVWNDQFLISNRGELFAPSRESYPEQLPLFTGPDGKHYYMLHSFNKMNRILSPLHAKITMLELTPYSTWQIKLDNGIKLRTGHQEVLTRLGHFVKVYDKIIGELASEVDYVDLRYTNGVAVKWKAPVKT